MLKDSVVEKKKLTLLTFTSEESVVGGKGQVQMRKE